MRVLTKSSANRLNQWYRNWQEPPWPLQPIRSLPPKYGVSIAVIVSLSIASATWLMHGRSPGEHYDPVFTTLAVLLSIALSWIPFRANEANTNGALHGVPLLFMFAGHPLVALFAATAIALAMPIRKPITFHLTVLNVCAGGAITLICARSFAMLAEHIECARRNGIWRPLRRRCSGTRYVS